MWKWILGGAAAYLLLTRKTNLAANASEAGVKAVLAKNLGTTADKIIITQTAAGYQATYNNQVVAGPYPTLNELIVAAGGDQFALIAQALAKAYGTSADKITITQEGAAYVARYNGQIIASGASANELATAAGM